jgi:ribosome-binding protein aMBF1 (putative translation factor)|tara:strand:+ start:7995 stop:8633 length:639 start_codon:yes stop_codon:yes gene_type:complete
MEECFKCYVPETKALLFDAVSLDGVVKICGKCSAKENIPTIKNNLSQNFEEKQTVRERLSKISGVNVDEKISFKVKEKSELKDLVDKNYNFKENLELKEELIHNFHWIVLRGRRMKHLTQSQLAQEIREPEILINKIEKGFAPESVGVILKLEKFLGIKIRESSEVPDFQEKSGDKFDVKNFEDLTIADLYDMKKKKEEEVLEDEKTLDDKE